MAVAVFTITAVFVTACSPPGDTGNAEAEAVAADKAALEIRYTDGDSIDSVTQNVTLPTSGMNDSGITWTSGNPAVISASGVVTRPVSDSTNMDVTLTATITKGAATVKKTFTLTVLKELSETEAVAADKDALDIDYADGDSMDSVTQNVTLPTNGMNDSGITWTSGNLAVISASGVVTRPVSDSTNMDVTLTATITKGAATDTRSFTLKVLRELNNAEAVDADKDALDIDYADGDSMDRVAQDVTLPTDGTNGSGITWTSDPAVISASGVVTRLDDSDTDVTLTATITKGTATDTRSFTLKVVSVFVSVEGGTFTMGSPSSESERDSDEVEHEVTVDSFYMSRYEITHREYIEFLNEAAVSETGQLNGNELIDMDDVDVAVVYEEGKFSFKGTDYVSSENAPVMEVTWYGAAEYANWLSDKSGLPKVYKEIGTSVKASWTVNGYRLPSEAEWEYAARGGNSSNGYKYAGGHSPGEVAWYWSNSGSKVHPVGGKNPNELGLYDMNGNVWEWCWDWYDDYSSGSQSNPSGPDSGSSRVRRGGSWDSSDRSLRSAYRSSSSPGYSDHNLGFRLVRREF